MAFQHLAGRDVCGMMVKVVDSGQEFIGKVQFMDLSRRRLGLVLEMGGLQLFHERDVQKVVEIGPKPINASIIAKTASELANMSVHSNISRKSSRQGDHVDIKVDEMNRDKQVQRSGDGEGRILGEEEMKKIFKEVRPDKPELPYYMNKDPRRNEHLENLHHIDMSDLLLHKTPTYLEEVEMLVDTDSCGHEFQQLPVVTQNSKPRIDANGHELHGGWQEKRIREKLWVTPDTPPHIETPARLYVVDKIGDLFEEAVDRLRHSVVVGLSLEGEMVGREGVLCWINLCNERDVFLFDILSLSQEGFNYGLRSILQDLKVIKVVHDCRQVNDCLINQWDVKLNSVWDTMAGDMVFSTQHVYDGFIPQYARSLPHLLKDYLGIADDKIFFPRYRRTHLAHDSSVWKTRPLPKHLVLGAARNTLYLLALYKVVKGATLLPFERAVHILVNHVREKDDPDADHLAFETKQLPNRVTGVLPEWRQDKDKAEDRGLFIDTPFIHQNVGNPDPILIFSKDSMHQAMPPHRNSSFPPFRSIFEGQQPKPSPVPRLY